MRVFLKVAYGWVAEIEKTIVHPIEMEQAMVFNNEPSSEVLVDFEYGNVNLDKFPLKQWKKCLTDVIDQENSWLFQYGDNQGEFALRQQISHYLLQSRGVHCTPEQIVITAGTQSSIALICKTLIDFPFYILIYRHQARLLNIR